MNEEKTLSVDKMEQLANLFGSRFPTMTNAMIIKGITGLNGAELRAVADIGRIAANGMWMNRMLNIQLFVQQ